MDIEKVLEDITKKLNIKKIFKYEPMSKHTSFRVGGPADILVIPETVEEIRTLLSCIKENKYPFFIMGNGSNLVVKDKGIRAIVIKILDNFNSITVNDDIIEAEAGILLSKLSNVAMRNGLSGLEFASGIPGTLGGAIAMNAGAYGGQISDILLETEYMDLEGQIKTLEMEKHEFGYRKSYFSNGSYVVLKARLKLVKCDKEEIKKEMQKLNAQRTEKQPLSFPSAGSIFKRPEGHFTGKLIQDAGLRGFTIGGAQVSEKHTGFIINKGGATAKDIINLIQYIKEKVRAISGVELETEVRIVGED